VERADIHWGQGLFGHQHYIAVLNIDSAISTTEITPKDLSRSYITNLTAPSVEDPIDSSPGQLPAVLLRIQPPDIYKT
jgi:hypothetical protein